MPPGCRNLVGVLLNSCKRLLAGPKAPSRHPYPSKTHPVAGKMKPFSFRLQPAWEGRALAIGPAAIWSHKDTIYLLTVQKAPFNLCFLWTKSCSCSNEACLKLLPRGAAKIGFLAVVGILIKG